MSHRIIVLDEAEDELIAAQRWYETQRAGLVRNSARRSTRPWTASQKHRLQLHQSSIL